MELRELCAVWNCLHDGCVEAISTFEGRVLFDVGCQYMAEVLGSPVERVFRVTVSEPAVWEPWERRDGEREPPTFADIAAHEASVMSAELIDSRVGVLLMFSGWHPDSPSGQGGGRLLLDAEGATLQWADGGLLATTDLFAASTRYWQAFGS